MLSGQALYFNTVISAHRGALERQIRACFLNKWYQQQPFYVIKNFPSKLSNLPVV